MKAWQPKVVGKRYEKSFQNPGKVNVGHENPVRNKQMGDMNKNNKNTDSRLVITELQAEQNITQSVTNINTNKKMST